MFGVVLCRGSGPAVACSGPAVAVPGHRTALLLLHGVSLRAECCVAPACGQLVSVSSTALIMWQKLGVRLDGSPATAAGGCSSAGRGHDALDASGCRLSEGRGEARGEARGCACCCCHMVWYGLSSSSSGGQPIEDDSCFWREPEGGEDCSCAR